MQTCGNIFSTNQSCGSQMSIMLFEKIFFIFNSNMTELPIEYFDILMKYSRISESNHSS